jgi:hypothetical protein
LLTFVGCATLPGTVKEGYGVAILSLSYVDDSDLRDSLVDIVLHFNHDKVAEKVSPRNGYTVISTKYTDLKVIGYSIQPKDNVSMAGGFGVVHPLSIDLFTQPGSVTVATYGLVVRQYRSKTKSFYSYYQQVRTFELGTLKRDALRVQLSKDANAKLWSFPAVPEPVQPVPEPSPLETGLKVESDT